VPQRKDRQVLVSAPVKGEFRVEIYALAGA